MGKSLKIGQLAKISGTTIDTIRFYEGKGLLKPESRSTSGYRNYGNDAKTRLSFIHSAKELGFTLAEIKGFLNIQVSERGQCSLAQEKIDEKMLAIDRKISDLHRMKNALKNISRKCHATKDGLACHFLEILEDINSEK